MNNHTDLLNYLVTTFNLQSYLEIGVSIPADNFDKIRCERKVGIDPNIQQSLGFTRTIYKATSDEMFKTFNSFLIKPIFNLIFIDGLHHADQVKRDFENSLRCLNDNGFIVIHDTLPEKEEYTHVPRDSKIWNGDVYKFAATLCSYSDIDFCTLEFDHGCTVVWKSKLKFETNPKIKADNWKEFQKNKKYLLRITTDKKFKDLMRDVQTIQLLKQNINQLS